jgi:serine/threonine protein kinase
MVQAASSPAQQEPTPTEHRYLSGEIVAEKYRLIRLLGEGGMGSVWVARNLALDIQVAIKLIRSDLHTPGIAERLLNEARTTARLRHPSIVRVFDFGRTRSGDPFIVMELLQGETLGTVLYREGRLPAPRALQLLLPAADGLVAAHAQRIVHRDLKPDNVFLAEIEGRLQPKVLDFGIASFERTREPTRLTLAGTVLGSPEYMAPEQARGQSDVDQRADIWAFCVVLYEAITGRVPFKGDNYNAQLLNVIEAPVTPILDHGAGDALLWSIMRRALTKDRDARWQTMREFGSALALWLIQHGVTEDVYGQSLRATWLDARSTTPCGAITALPAPNSPVTVVSRRPTHWGASRYRKVWLAVALLGVVGVVITTVKLRTSSREPATVAWPTPSPVASNSNATVRPVVTPLQSSAPSPAIAPDSLPMAAIDQHEPVPSARRRPPQQAVSNSAAAEPPNTSGASAPTDGLDVASPPTHHTRSASSQAPTDAGGPPPRVYDEDLGF